MPENNTSDSDESKIPGGSSVTTEPDGAEPNDISLDALQNKISQNSIAVGVAFIGYVNSESTELTPWSGLMSIKQTSKIKQA